MRQRGEEGVSWIVAFPGFPCALFSKSKNKSFLGEVEIEDVWESRMKSKFYQAFLKGPVLHDPRENHSHKTVYGHMYK